MSAGDLGTRTPVRGSELGYPNCRRATERNIQSTQLRSDQVSCRSRRCVQISVVGDGKSTTLIVAVAGRLLSSGRVSNMLRRRCWSYTSRGFVAGMRRRSLARRPLVDVKKLGAAFRRSAWLILRIEETNLFRSISRRT